jgi:ankyrin repeat protein
VTYGKDDLTYALYKVSGRGDVATMRLLIDAGADVTYSGYSSSVLTEGVKSRKAEAVRLLLERGAMQGTDDVKSSYRGGKSAIMHACSNGDLEIVILLVEKGANVNNLTISTGDTPLLCAVDKGKTAVAEYLIGKGADINKSKTYDWEISGLIVPGISPLMMAAYNGNAPLVKLLLKGGAELDLTDCWGEDALVKAKKMKHEDIVKLLIEAGAAY